MGKTPHPNDRRHNKTRHRKIRQRKPPNKSSTSQTTQRRNEQKKRRTIPSRTIRGRTTMKTKIHDLEISDRNKKMLTIIATTPNANVAKIAAKLKIGYSTTFQNLSILDALEHIHRIKTERGKTLYILKGCEL